MGEQITELGAPGLHYCIGTLGQEELPLCQRQKETLLCWVPRALSARNGEISSVAKAPERSDTSARGTPDAPVRNF